MIVGHTIGQFLIEKELGSGAMGSVYRARYVGEDARLIKELNSNRRVALKVIAFGLANNDLALARFEREAKILKQLRHENIVRLYGTGRYRDTPFFVMEYIDGQSMDRILLRRDRFSWEEVVDYGKHLCAALQHAHEKGIIHRDLKPSNLMVTKDGVLKLTDFGIAKDVDVTALTGANNTIGTAAYMSPEQCKGEKVLTAKSDLYSLGIVFYELLTGRKPFVAESSVDMFLLHVQGTFMRPSKIVPEIPMWLDTLVCQLMEKKPEHRPLDAAMVLRSLEEVAEKVASQKSIGAEIASARNMDRVHLTGELDESDKAIGKTIKAGLKKKKLKKKTVPIYRRGWFTLTASILFVAGFAFLLYSLLRPDSAETMAERIEKAANPDARRTYVKEYLARYGETKDERTEKIRGIYRADKAKEHERILFNRFAKTNLRDNIDESFDKEAHRSSMNAIEFEMEGNIGAARQLWKEVADKFSSDANEAKAVFGWVGTKKMADIDELPRLEAQLKKKIEQNDIDEKEQKFDDPLEAKIAAAFRCESLKDTFTARDRWAKIKDEVGKIPEQRPWLLIAARRIREIDGQKEKMKADDREKLLAETLEQARAEAYLEEDNPVRRRDGRNRLRDLRDVYEFEIDSLKKFSTQAAELLKKAPRM